MKRLKRIVSLGIVLLAVACSKNQVKTDRLDGKWDVSHMVIYANDGSVALATNPDGVFEFQRCNLRKNDFCTYSHQIHYSHDSLAHTKQVTGEYRFDDKGRKLILREQNPDGSFRELVYTVIDFKCDVLRMESTEGPRIVYTLVLI